MLNGQNTLPSYPLDTCAPKKLWHIPRVIPRRFCLAAIFAVYLGYVAANHISGQVPLWAYLALGNAIMLIALPILRREHRLAITRSAER